MHGAIRTGYKLSVVSEETASWEAGARVEGYVADGLLNWKGLSSVGGFPDKVFDLRVEHVVPAVVPTHIDTPAGSSRRPCEEVASQIVKDVIVDAYDVRRACVHIDVCNINAGRAFELSTRYLIR